MPDRPVAKLIYLAHPGTRGEGNTRTLPAHECQPLEPLPALNDLHTEFGLEVGDPDTAVQPLPFARMRSFSPPQTWPISGSRTGES